MRIWRRTRFVTIPAGISIRQRRHSLEKLAAEPEPIGPVTVREQAIVPDALKAAWQRVQQETAHELAGIQRHHLRLSTLAIVLPAKADMVAGERNQPTVGDRHPMRVARQISQNLGRTGKWALGVDHPFASAQRSQIGRKGLWRLQPSERGEELKLAGGVGRLQSLEEQPPEQA